MAGSNFQLIADPPKMTVPVLIPGGDPKQIIPGGPWFRLTNLGVLQIYANGAWTSTPQVAPNHSVPNPNPPLRSGPPPSAVRIGIMGGEAVYNSLSSLWDAIQAVIAVDAETQRLIDAGTRLRQIEARAVDWVDWLKTNPLGRQLAGVLACIANGIKVVQAEIDRILAIPEETRNWAPYYHLATLQMTLTSMQNTVKYVQELRHHFITYGGNLPDADQVNSITCIPIPLEMAPMPLPTVIVPPQAIVPDAPAIGNGPIFPGIARPPKPLFGEDEETNALVAVMIDLQKYRSV